MSLSPHRQHRQLHFCFAATSKNILDMVARSVHEDEQSNWTPIDREICFVSSSVAECSRMIQGLVQALRHLVLVCQPVALGLQLL
jgi:hypothetical protein